MTHSECVKKLIEAGNRLDFHATGRSFGKRYKLGNPDVVWYYIGKGEKALRKIAKGDNYKYLPILAFEVPYSEKEKALRGSLTTLQLTGASAGIIVLIGKSVKYKSYMRKLIGRYSSGRFRLWQEKEVNELCNQAIEESKARDIFHAST